MSKRPSKDPISKKICKCHSKHFISGANYLVKEMQIETKMRYNYIPIWMYKSKAKNR